MAAPVIGRARLILIACMFLLFGSIGSIMTKWADTQVALSADGTVKDFAHPYVQNMVMFWCELLCLVAFQATVLYKTKVQGAPLKPGVDIAVEPCNRLAFMVPAMLDLLSSGMMYVGMTLTSVSVYQMLRGASILWAGLLSRVWLKRRFQNYEWLGMILVTLGLACVGLASTIFTAKGAKQEKNPFLGDIIIFASQAVSAACTVSEERIFRLYSPHPLQLMGWEGVFGTAVMAIVLGAMLFNGGRPDDVYDWGVQVGNSWQAQTWLVCTLCTLSTYNGAGQAITKYVSATARVVLDALRTVVVWAAGMLWFGEKFNFLQLVGFILLVSGTFIFRRIVPVPCAFLAHDDALEAANLRLGDEDPTPEGDGSGARRRGQGHCDQSDLLYAELVTAGSE